jgi:subtilisin family serine protease
MVSFTDISRRINPLTFVNGYKAMIELNHTIIWAKDKWASVEFLARVLGLPIGAQWGDFVPIRVNSRAALGYADTKDQIRGAVHTLASAGIRVQTQWPRYAYIIPTMPLKVRSAQWRIRVD